MTVWKFEILVRDTDDALLRVVFFSIPKSVASELIDAATKIMSLASIKDVD